MTPSNTPTLDKEQVSRFKTVYGVYWVSPFRMDGGSEFYGTRTDAVKALASIPDGWESRVEKQTYELEKDSHHDCGDDE